MSLHPNWKSLSTVALPWKTFVREGESYIPKKKKDLTVFKQNLTGDEAKELYEEILKSEGKQPFAKDLGDTNVTQKIVVESPKTEATNKNYNIKHHASSNTSHKDDILFWTNKLMKAAQANEVTAVSSLLEERPELHINIVDQFGWTALMCASASGSFDVVKFLLRNGADTSVKDKSGNCCLSIARRMKYSEIIDSINSKNILQEKVPTSSSETEENSFFCDVCKRTFSDGRDKHITSTIHLFNSHPGGSKTFYSIPESNRGFQILLKAGWDKERGLGPEGSGSKFPLKTVLRKDRRGLGQPNKTQPRVTHFDPFSTSAVRTERKCKGRKERNYTIQREKRRERFFRKELS